MSISIIAAVAENNVIGVKNGLPWKLSGDLKYFARTTKGKTVLMGRNTYFSIVGMIGKPLPNRKNVVLTDVKDGIKDVDIVENWDAITERAKSEEIFIIGGASIYKQAISFADKLYITKVFCNVSGDAFFPEIKNEEWVLISEESHQKDESNDYDYSFQVYERKQK